MFFCTKKEDTDNSVKHSVISSHLQKAHCGKTNLPSLMSCLKVKNISAYFYENLSNFLNLLYCWYFMPFPPLGRNSCLNFYERGKCWMIIHIKGIYSHFPKVLINRSCQLQEMSVMELHCTLSSALSHLTFFSMG